MERLLRPKSIAVIGGGAWGKAVVETARNSGFTGPIWPVHPRRADIGGEASYPSLTDLPGVPDATFVAVNREATLDAVAALAGMGAGGAIAFASGFAEDGATDLQAELVARAGDMPVLGPNCYGMINALDGVALWPDRHGLAPVERGVGIVTQSGNILLNLTMQQRGLPIAYAVAAGNQAQMGVAEIGLAMLADDRVTALGLHIEGISDLAAYEALAAEAHRLGKPIVALKVGRSEGARAAGLSHTAAMMGSAAGASALLARLGIAELRGLGAFLQCLQIFHHLGPLPSPSLGLMACSGGEAGLLSDLAMDYGLTLPGLTQAQTDRLGAVLGPKVKLANPLDYHTYIWGNQSALTEMIEGMLEGDAALSAIVLDFPQARFNPMPDWDAVVAAAGAAAARSAKPVAILSSLSDAMPEERARQIMAEGVVPLAGLEDAFAAIRAAASVHAPTEQAVWPAPQGGPSVVLSEHSAKAQLARFGLDVPKGVRTGGALAAGQAAAAFSGQVVLKGMGAAHKTEAGLVAVGLDPETVVARAADMAAEEFLVEEMVDGALVELLIGVLADPVHGFVLSLGAGGIWAELLGDTQVLLLPCTQAEIDTALERLAIAPLLLGYRGQPPVDRNALRRAIMAVQAFVEAHQNRLLELEINPLICTAKRAVAVDAIIRWEASA